MKLQLAILLSLTFLSSQLLAQTISTQLETETATVTASQGVRLSLMKPFLETRLDTEFPGLEGGTTKSRENETSFGLGVGYADLPIRDIGFTTNASYLFLDQDQADSILRLDGNLGYAFNSKLNLKGGVNVSKYFDGEIG